MSHCRAPELTQLAMRLVDSRALSAEVIDRAREAVAAWHDAARLDGPERFARAMDRLEALVGRDD